jgi:hypothetical protein
MKYPKVINILGRPVKIKLVKNVAFQGCSRHAKALIELNTDYNEHQMEETFLHELLHQIFFINSWQWYFSSMSKYLANKKTDFEELFICSLAPTLYQVIKDNKLFRG